MLQSTDLNLPLP